MPLIDVTEILSDPDLVDAFVVLRRPEAVGDDGRMIVVPTQGLTFNGGQVLYNGQPLLTVEAIDAYGTVQSAGANDLERLPDYQRAGKHLSIVSTFRLRSESTGYQPDIIVWPPDTGDQYVVIALDDYSRHGAGFVQVIAKLIDSTAVAPA